MSRLAILCIRGYQRLIRPWLPNCCRFVPSCSEYCIEAIRKNGLIVGIIKGAYRIIRCNPFGKGGHDPVG